MNKVLALLLALCMAKPLVACLNESGTTLKGDKVSRSRGQLHDLLRSLLVDPTSRGLEMEQRLQGKTDFASRNDYAVALVLLGRNAEAISLLEEMEKERPGSISIDRKVAICEENGSSGGEFVFRLCSARSRYSHR